MQPPPRQVDEDGPEVDSTDPGPADAEPQAEPPAGSTPARPARFWALDAVTREGNKSALIAVTRLIGDRDVRKPGGVASI